MEIPKYQTALIVGAGEGLSASLARLLSGEGLRVALAARKIEKLGALCSETGASAFACNAADAGEVERLFGMVERDGKMRAGPIPNALAYTLQNIIRVNVHKGTTVSTDEWQGYNDLPLMGMVRGTVKHSDKEWVRGIHHTNTIEGHWGHFKRAVRGTHVHISGKHAWKYVAEFTYRRNFRHSHEEMFNRLVAAFALPRLQDA